MLDLLARDRDVISVLEGVPYLGRHRLFQGDAQALVAQIGVLSKDDDVHLVVTPNVDQVLSMPSSPMEDSVMDNASLLIIDGAPILALARVLGAKNAFRNTGADLLPLVAEASADHGWKVAILGGPEEVGLEAATKLSGQYPGATVNHVAFPFVEAGDLRGARAVVDSLSEMDPDIVFVCLGSPKQERWVQEHREDLPSAVYIGAGAAVDFAAGAKTRAPRVVQKCGLEWAWRLVQEPRRLARRYLVRGPLFIGVVFRSLLMQSRINRQKFRFPRNHR